MRPGTDGDRLLLGECAYRKPHRLPNRGPHSTVGEPETDPEAGAQESQVVGYAASAVGVRGAVSDTMANGSPAERRRPLLIVHESCAADRWRSKLPEPELTHEFLKSGARFDDFESRCSATVEKWPDFDDFESLIGYQIAVIFAGRQTAISANFGRFSWFSSGSEAEGDNRSRGDPRIWARCCASSSRPDFPERVAMQPSRAYADPFSTTPCTRLGRWMFLNAFHMAVRHG